MVDDKTLLKQVDYTYADEIVNAVSQMDGLNVQREPGRAKATIEMRQT